MCALNPQQSQFCISYPLFQEPQVSEYHACATYEQRFGAVGRRAGDFTGALNDPAICLALDTMP